MNIYEAVCRVLENEKGDYIVKYPYLVSSADLVKGYITCYELEREVLNTRSTLYTDDGSIINREIESIELQIDIFKYIDYNKGSNTMEQASLIKAYLNSVEALDLFYSYGYELAHIVDNIQTNTDYDDNKKWLSHSFFKIKVYHYVGEARMIDPLAIDKIVLEGM